MQSHTRIKLNEATEVGIPLILPPRHGAPSIDVDDAKAPRDTLESPPAPVIHRPEERAKVSGGGSGSK